MKEAEATGLDPELSLFLYSFLGKNEFQKCFPSIIEGMNIMIYDVLVVYPMKSSVNKFL